MCRPRTVRQYTSTHISRDGHGRDGRNIPTFLKYSEQVLSNCIILTPVVLILGYFLFYIPVFSFVAKLRLEYLLGKRYHVNTLRFSYFDVSTNDDYLDHVCKPVRGRGIVVVTCRLRCARSILKSLQKTVTRSESQQQCQDSRRRRGCQKE